MSEGAGDELERIRELRQRGLTPREIARAVGLPPARVTHLVRKLAAAESIDPTQRPVLECWVSPGWNAGLTVTGHPDWPVEPTDENTSSGLAAVLVAREAGRERVSVCAWLVDTYCLGLKNDLGPVVEYRSSLPRMVHDFFAALGERPVAAPLELAQHLVLGAVDYARGLGFEPAREADFAGTRGHLGPWEGPSAIGFGRHGKPFFIAGPNDDAARVVRQLERSVGRGNYDYVVGMPE
jgi:hypothetical protein